MIVNLIISCIVSLIAVAYLCRSRAWRLYRVASMTVAPLGWLAMLLISVAISALSYVIMPKAKPPKPQAAKEMDSPVAQAGKPVSVVMGTIICTELNILWTGDKSIKTYDTTAT